MTYTLVVSMNKTTKRMDKGFKYLSIVTFTLENIKITLLNNTESTTGQVEPTIEESSCQECVMEKESGTCYMETATKVNT